jgi:hypothetical protein
MLFVLLSHFGTAYFADATRPLPTALLVIGMIASPTFAIINGLMIGFLYRTRRDGYEHLHTVFTDRGLFLLTIGHIAILLSHPLYAVRFVCITDVMGLSMILQPRLVMMTRPRTRLLMAAALFAVSWFAIEAWYPHAAVAQDLKEGLFGSLMPLTGFTYVFPVFPWLSLALGASALGDRLGELCLCGDEAAMQRTLTRLALRGAIAAIAFNVTYHLIKVLGLAPKFAVTAVGSPFAKIPPSPVYFLWYGALGLCLIATCLHVVRFNKAPRVMAFLATLGQTSFALFVIQFFVYFTVLYGFRGHLPWEGAWPVYFALSVVVILVPALAWHRTGCNRFLTVGYRYRASREAEDAGRIGGPAFQPALPLSARQ